MAAARASVPFSFANKQSVDATFESVSNTPPEALAVDIFGDVIMRSPPDQLQQIFNSTAQFKKRHDILLRRMRCLVNELHIAGNINLKNRLKSFVRKVLRTLLGTSTFTICFTVDEVPAISVGTVEFVFSNPPEDVPQLKGFNEHIQLKGYTSMLRGKGFYGMIRARNFFLFYYIMGILRKILVFKTHIRLRKLEKIGFLDETTSLNDSVSEAPEENYKLSKFVRSPRVSDFLDFQKTRFPLFSACLKNHKSFVLKHMIGEGMYEKFDNEHKRVIDKIVESFCRRVQTKLEKILEYYGRIEGPIVSSSFITHTLHNLMNTFFQVPCLSGLFPIENLTSSVKKLSASFSNWQNETLYASLDPCPSAVPVSFIENLNRDKYPTEMLRAVFYNSMYFAINMFLECLSILAFPRKKKGQYQLMRVGPTSFRKVKDYLRSIALPLKTSNQLTLSSKIESEKSDKLSLPLESCEERKRVKRKFEEEEDEEEEETYKRPAKKEIPFLQETEEPCIPGFSVSTSAESKHSNDLNINSDPDEIQMYSPEKRPIEYVTLDSDSEEEIEEDDEDRSIIKKNQWKSDLELIQTTNDVPDYLKAFAQHVVAENLQDSFD